MNEQDRPITETELDSLLAAAEATPGGQILTAIGQRARPAPEFVAWLGADLARRSAPAPRLIRPRPIFRRFAIAGAMLVLLLSAIALLLNQATPVSAAQVLVHAAAPSLQSFHGIMSGQHRESSSQPFVSERWELWFQAPSRARIEATIIDPDGKQAPDGYVVDDGQELWSYDPPPAEIHRRDSDALDNFFSFTSLGQTIGETNHQGYDATLLADDVVSGRKAYTIDLFARPGANTAAAHSRLWIDKQTYLPLRQQECDSIGALLTEVTFTSLDFNSTLDTAIFRFVPPPGIPVIDQRSARTQAEEDALWQQMARQSGLTAFQPAFAATTAPEKTEFNAVQGQIITEATIKLPSGAEYTLHITEGQPASLPAVGVGATPVQLDGVTAQYWTRFGQELLGFERDGTRVTLFTRAGAEAKALLIKTAQSLKPVAVQ